jgi:hypothetical protein
MGWELGGWSVIGVLRMWELCKEEAPSQGALLEASAETLASATCTMINTLPCNAKAAGNRRRSSAPNTRFRLGAARWK